MQNKSGCYATNVKTLYQMDGNEIAEKLKTLQGKSSEAEYRAWCNSIPVLVNVLHLAGLDELTLVLEYQTPIGSRIDAVLLGERRGIGKPLVLIIELKQWSAIEENLEGRESSVSICISKVENRFEDRLHPIQQTLTYAKHLRMNHSNIADGKMEVRCCQFLHNFEDKEQLFQGNYRDYAKLQHETYGKGEGDKLSADLGQLFSTRPRPDVVDLFLNGTYVLGKVSFADLKRVLEKKENAAMLDDQIEINRIVCNMVDKLYDGQSCKELVIISGPPGTGKTVIGLHILYAYCRKFGSTGKNDGGCIFALPRSRTLAQVITGASGISPVYLEAIPPGRDIVVVDEAHRIENLDAVMTSLFRKTSMVVVLQDDRQRIRPTEDGTLENFKQFAETHDIHFVTCSLASQKRAGYLGNYVSNLDRLLYDRWNEPLQWQSALEVRCWDSLCKLDEHLHDLAASGRHVKWYAPFCWPWSKSVRRMDIVIPQTDGAFQKAWNPIGDQYRWYMGESERNLDQVGCIYTAQGLEFDDIGVIWWKDLRWDGRNQEWYVDLNTYYDTQLLSSIKISRTNQSAIVELILNTYRVLLTRAKSSVHIWFSDPATEKHVRKVLGF